MADDITALAVKGVHAVVFQMCNVIHLYIDECKFVSTIYIYAYILLNTNESHFDSAMIYRIVKRSQDGRF